MSYYDIKAEQQTLGCILRSQTKLIEGIKTLTEEHYTNSKHKLIYTSIKELFNDGIAIDLTTVGSHLETKDQLILTGGLGYLEQLTTSVEELDHFDEYVRILSDRLVRRRIRRACDDVLITVNNQPNIESVIDGFETSAFAIRSKHGRDTARKAWTAEELAEWAQDYLDGKEEEQADTFPYPFPQLQQRLGGYSRGELSIIAGYSGDGKSICGLQILEAACRMGARVGYWSLEMPEKQIQRRLLSNIGVPLKVLKDRSFDDTQKQVVKERINQLRRYQYDVYAGTTTMEYIRAEQVRKAYDVVIVDHLHRLPNSEDRLTLEKNTRMAKDLALDTNSAVVCLAQLSRREGFPPPNTNQLRGTDVLTQEADVALFIYRERDIDSIRLDDGKIIVGKVRDGEDGTPIMVRFKPERMVFEEVFNAA